MCCMYVSGFLFLHFLPTNAHICYVGHNDIFIFKSLNSYMFLILLVHRQGVGLLEFLLYKTVTKHAEVSFYSCVHLLAKISAIGF